MSTCTTAVPASAAWPTLIISETLATRPRSSSLLHASDAHSWSPHAALPALRARPLLPLPLLNVLQPCVPSHLQLRRLRALHSGRRLRGQHGLLQDDSGNGCGWHLHLLWNGAIGERQHRIMSRVHEATRAQVERIPRRLGGMATDGDATDGDATAARLRAIARPDHTERCAVSRRTDTQSADAQICADGAEAGGGSPFNLRIYDICRIPSRCGMQLMERRVTLLTLVLLMEDRGRASARRLCDLHIDPCILVSVIPILVYSTVRVSDSFSSVYRFRQSRFTVTSHSQTRTCLGCFLLYKSTGAC